MSDVFNCSLFVLSTTLYSTLRLKKPQIILEGLENFLNILELVGTATSNMFGQSVLSFIQEIGL
jgi:hypothetical protein